MSNKMTDKEKLLLEPFGELIAQFRTLIEDSTDASLVELASAASKATISNCWWATYRAAQEIISLVAHEQQRRVLAAHETANNPKEDR